MNIMVLFTSKRVSNLEFFFFHSRIKPYIIAPVNEAKAERLVAIRYSALKKLRYFLYWLVYVRFLIAGFDAVLLVI